MPERREEPRDAGPPGDAGARRRSRSSWYRGLAERVGPLAERVGLSSERVGSRRHAGARAGGHPASVHHPFFARGYVRMAPKLDVRAGLGPLRRELLAGLSGRVIEIGAGSGLNFPHYPGTVSEVVALEPEPVLRHAARTEAARSDVPVDVVPGVAEALPVKSDAFDAAVISLVLCSVRDVPRTLAELQRVLRPGAEVRFLEHVRAEGRGLRAVQWVADHTLWPLVSGNCHTGRDSMAAMRAAGFVVERHRRLRLMSGVPLPVAPIVLGAARRPGGPAA